MGLPSDLRVTEFREDETSTSIEFNFSRRPLSHYEPDYLGAAELWLILAYSEQDDFEHHSAVRVHRPVKL